MEHGVSLEALIFEGGKAVSCPLSSESINTFLVFLRELTEWNERVNLTGLKNEFDMVVELFVDSLACGLALSPEKKGSIIDIGSGAGFPGIPLKIAYPELEITLLEPRLKKTAFMHHIIGTLNLKNIHVISRSVQDLYQDGSFNIMYDKAIARAVRPDSIFPEARSLLRDSGRAVLCRSKRLGSCEEAWGMKVEREIDYELPNEYGKRVLSILRPL
ncbi:MAG: 16S rRNA (guanine(527)-N(7))-methyltransferase RsmG [Nitrospirota bacterium]|nr:MAG: 16S rRNA (guanine(527)-N(7))-methyltransferase RsmG [Nitrospirota bacterium]